jgi:hypothetical protein
MPDIKIYQGTDWAQIINYADASNVAIPIISAISQMRASPNGPVLATFTCTVSTATTGQITHAMPATVSKTIAITGNDFNPRVFYYDVIVTRSDGAILQPPVAGKVFFFPEVTIE